MKEILLPKNKVKNFLADRLTQEVLQLDEHRIFSLIRYEGIGGFNKMSDNELFVKLVDIVPEFQLIKIIRADNDNLTICLKDEYLDKEDEILIDINRIIQMKLS
jgi:hypothetical protein